MNLFKVSYLKKDSQGDQWLDFIQFMFAPEGTTSYDIVEIFREHHMAVIVEEFERD